VQGSSQLVDWQADEYVSGFSSFNSDSLFFNFRLFCAID
jgi:hypothetical protein